MNTQIPDLRVQNKLPLRATVLIPEAVRDQMFRGKPASFTGGPRMHEFPLGREFERATREAFGQVFQRLEVARQRPESRDVEVLIEPEILDFHFRYDQLSYVGFAIAAVSRIRVRVTAGDGEWVVWTRSVQTPEERSGPWFIDLSYEDHTGRAASRALGNAATVGRRARSARHSGWRAAGPASPGSASTTSGTRRRARWSCEGRRSRR